MLAAGNVTHDCTSNNNSNGSADALDVGVGFEEKEGADVLGWHGDELLLGQPEDRLRFVPRVEAQHVIGFGRRVGEAAASYAKSATKKAA